MLEISNGNLGYNQNVIISDVNFSISKGQSIGIIGKSGSGKTTVLNTIYNEIPIINGEINNTFKSTSVIFQHDGLFPWLTIRDNLALTIDADDSEIINVCTKLGIEDNIDNYVSKLSGGQKQRVQIARMLLSKAELIIMDEPTSSLDLVNKAQFIKLIKENITEKQALIIVSHDIEEVMMLSDTIIILDEGIHKHTIANVSKGKRNFDNQEFILMCNHLRELIIDEK